MWAAYEQAKRAWVVANPDATAEQYDAAIQALLASMNL